jgi:hypothetical protein
VVCGGQGGEAGQHVDAFGVCVNASSPCFFIAVGAGVEGFIYSE